LGSILNDTIISKMDILYTVEEKYLQAIEELNYGELPKALHLFHELISLNPEYARAHYQLGCFYHHQFKDYQTAGYYYKTCIELDPCFPDVYQHYLLLAVTLELHKLVPYIANKALITPGVSKANIYESLGLYEEKKQHFAAAKTQFKMAASAAESETEHRLYQDHLKRIFEKQNSNQRMVYAYQEGS